MQSGCCRCNRNGGGGATASMGCGACGKGRFIRQLPRGFKYLGDGDDCLLVGMLWLSELVVFALHIKHVDPESVYKYTFHICIYIYVIFYIL